MRNTTPPTSRRTASSTTPATWRCCAPRSRAARSCWPRPRPAWKPGPMSRPANTPASTCRARFGAAEMPADARHRHARRKAARRPLDLRASGPRRRRPASTPANRRCCSSTAAAMRRSPSAAPAAIRSAATIATRAWSSTASSSGWSATNAAPPSRCPTACPACEVEGRMAAVGPGVERLAEEVAARFPEARLAVLSSDLFGSARALKDQIALIAEGGGRHHHRHADRRQGPQLPAADAGRRDRRRPWPARVGPARGRAHLPADAPGGGPRRPRRQAGRGAAADLPARTPGDPRHPRRRRRGLLARRGGRAPRRRGAALWPHGRDHPVSARCGAGL